MTQTIQQLPRISLITASLNAEKTIERTLRSIEMQGYPNLQMISVDGKSSDATADIIARYRHIVSVVVSEKDKNVAEAINKGFKLADGDIFFYLNADDALTPGTLHTIAKTFLENADIDVVTGACRRVFADGSELVTQVPDHFLDVISMLNAIEQPSTFWRASVHRKLGTLDESFILAFDWEWWNRLYAAGARFKRMTDVLSVYYFTDDNLTSKGGMRVIDEMYRITKKYGPYKGYIANVYKFLFRTFDMHGYYDKPYAQLPIIKRIVFGSTLTMLCAIFGRQCVYSYNWNWASKQIRGIVWYK
jgi:glycosyltransferase involved in cell wall biosynthesis